MGRVMRYGRLYWLFLLQRLKILMEYRVNFLIGASLPQHCQNLLLARGQRFVNGASAGACPHVS